MKYYLGICVAIIGVLSCSCQTLANNGLKEISQQEAIEIALIEAERLGYDVNSENIEMEVLHNNTPWGKYFPDMEYFKTDDYYAEINKKLESRLYWGIYFHIKQFASKGGDICVFVDSATGEIIAVYRGA